ncbi:MAG: tetratricopeptide repeat protein [Planctomycetota bacterium]|nr:tetratricopeptide repeat protein [Planctomycetota bacterium]
MRVPWALLPVGTLVVACGPKIDVPMPDLARVEPGVVAKVQSCRAAVLADPSVDSWARYGRTLHAHRMMLQAEQAYLAAADVAGADTSAAFEYLHLAGCAALEGRAEQSIGYFQRALELRDDFLPTHLCLALASERLGRADLARRHYQRVLSSVESSHARLGLGRLALRSGDAKAAIGQFDKALAVNSEHREVYEAKARAHARLKEMDESRAVAKLAGDLSETTPYVDPLLGKVQAEAVDINSRFNRGSKHANDGRDPEAIVEFSAVVKARPRHVHARYYLALLYKRTEADSQAMKHANVILEQRPDHKKTLELRARMFLKQGRKSDAERDLRALLKLEPAHAWAKAQLGN